MAGFRSAVPLIILSLSFATIVSCKKNQTPTVMATGNYEQVNLVADQSSSGAAHTDPNLINAWGLAISSSGSFFISSNHGGVSTIYDTTGASLLAPIVIPKPGALSGGAPSGVVFNSTSDFVITATGETSKFIFATEDGTIAAWSSAGIALIVADRSSAGAVYKGLTIANDGTGNFIYAANFKGGTIDVFDHTFAYVSGKTFTDPNIPAGFAPFNVRNINNMLYVTYAMQKGPDNMDDQAGPGNGYVDIYKPDGTLVSRFASQGSLNSPWGIAAAPSGFGAGQNAILISNFGDGTINVFNQDGTTAGPLKDSNGNTLSINGIWDMSFPVNGEPAGNPNRLFFTAGPASESHGLFGYLQLK